MYEENGLLDTMSMENSSSGYFQSILRYNEPRMGGIHSSPVDLTPELADVSDESDIDTDDSSKFLNRLFTDDFHGLQVNDSISSSWSGDSDRFIVTISTPNNGVMEEHPDPMYQLVVARSQFEERLMQRESERLRTPESLTILEIFCDSILSPVATLLLQLYVPRDWRSCESCGGFYETYCCLKSLLFREIQEAGGSVVLNYQPLTAH
jgi:hypothetical protein